MITNNREIVDYILSNKLKEDEVIKEVTRYSDDEEYIMYIFNDKYDLWDDNGKISITRFNDRIPNLNGNIIYICSYEIISKNQAIKEINDKEKQEKIQRLKDELEKLESEVN